jgi:hypothetical protein
MREYQFVLDAVVFRFLEGLRKSERLTLVRAFERLASDPFVRPDGEQRTSLRTFSLKRVGRFMLVYWVDHSSVEVRIVEVLAG